MDINQLLLIIIGLVEQKYYIGRNIHEVVSNFCEKNIAILVRVINKNNKYKESHRVPNVKNKISYLFHQLPTNNHLL